MKVYVNKTTDFKSVIEKADKLFDKEDTNFLSLLIHKDYSEGLIKYMIESGISRLDMHGSDLFIKGSKRYEVKEIEEII